MESNVRITSSALPPPGSTTSTSATNITTPNFQASCIAPKASRSVDRARAQQNEHERAQGDAVDHEDDRGVTRQVAKQERDRGVTEDERAQRRHHQGYRSGVASLLPTRDRAELEQPGQDHGGNGKQKGEACRRGPVQTQEQARGD